MSDWIAPRGPQSVDSDFVDSFVKGESRETEVGLYRPSATVIPPLWGDRFAD
jgi:hypothetical protein